MVLADRGPCRDLALALAGDLALALAGVWPHPYFRTMTQAEDDLPNKKPSLEDHLALVPVGDARNESRVRARFWPKLKRVMSRIPFAADLVTAYYCATDPKTPTRVKALLFAGLAYFVMPVDVIPDMIVGLGFTDDASVLAAIVALINSHIKPHHRAAAEKALKEQEHAPEPKTKL